MPYHDEALAVLQMYRGAKALLANFKQDEELPAAYFGNVYIKRDYYEACTDWCHAQMVLHGDFGETGVSAREVHRTASERLVRARMFLKRAIETCGCVVAVGKRMTVIRWLGKRQREVLRN